VSSVVHLTDNPSIDVNPAWSPDGTRIAFVSTRDGGFDIYVLGVECASLPEGCDSNAIQLTDHPALDGKPAWSPDGTRIAFESDRNGNRDIYLMDAECASLPKGCGSNAIQLTDHPADDFHPAWSPDGTHIAFESERDGDPDIYLMDAECASLPKGCGSNVVQLTDHPANDRQPAWLWLIWL
jgi:TolB protein